jgi:hypothetical protein
VRGGKLIQSASLFLLSIFASVEFGNRHVFSLLVLVAGSLFKKPGVRAGSEWHQLRETLLATTTRQASTDTAQRSCLHTIMRSHEVNGVRTSTYRYRASSATVSTNYCFRKFCDDSSQNFLKQNSPYCSQEVPTATCTTTAAILNSSYSIRVDYD